MKPPVSRIKKEVTRILPEVRMIRHQLHAHPELALHEAKTSEFIRNRLRKLDVQLYDPFLSTDVVALLSGKSGGKNITLRADMDALPLQETKKHSYSSMQKNVMHACGHDGHSAVLLGAATVLDKFRGSLKGSVRFVFQPGEEIVAAGRDLVNKGIMDNPVPDAVLALHSWPGFPTGSICSRPGPFMAAADIFKITIKGKGGHGSAPENAIDPILTAARIINGLYLIPSRKVRAQDSVVISTGSIRGGTSANIIPDEVILNGTVRYITRERGKTLPALIEETIRAECACTGAHYKLEYTRPYIPAVNDSQIVSMCKDITGQYMGKTTWIDIDEPVMGSEDFSYYLDKYPGAMFFLGMGENSPQLHSSAFDFNDEALRNGILFFVLAALHILSR